MRNPPERGLSRPDGRDSTHPPPDPDTSVLHRLRIPRSQGIPQAPAHLSNAWLLSSAASAQGQGQQGSVRVPARAGAQDPRCAARRTTPTPLPFNYVLCPSYRGATREHTFRARHPAMCEQERGPGGLCASDHAAEVDLHVAAQLAGNASLETTNLYDRRGEQAKMPAVGRLGL